MSNLLKDYDPKLTEHTLSFICPACGHHRIIVPISSGRWRASGDLEHLTIVPSVNVDNDHWHHNITNGEFK